MKKEFEIRYHSKDGSLSHTYIESFEYDELVYCPHCGSLGIWVKAGVGDYHVGSEHQCTNCSAVFTLQLYTPDESDGIKQRLAHLRS